ncbi:MAG: hypothetical protein EOP00_30850 [Pedobacter sp.]|nr:MAG: hypothetical protein EOP00_30850 [Pedobacter sp.]
MNKIFTSAILLFGCCNLSVAQSGLGARLLAMGNNATAVKDVWSINTNPAGITNLKQPKVALSYGKTLFDTDISHQALAFVLPAKRSYIGLNVVRYGITEYNEINTGIAFAKTFGEQMSIGVKLNYHQIRISNYGSTRGFSADVGAIYQFNDVLTFGANINNPSCQSYSTKNIAAKIPTIFAVGASYNASSKVLVATYIKKEVHQSIDVGLGVDYQLVEIFSLRAGITAKAFKQYAGFGLNYKSLTVDMAVENDPNLGYTPQIAVGYAF